MPPASPSGRTFSVRLSSAEHDRLVELAQARSVDPSTLVRAWIAEGGSTSTVPGAPSTPDAVPRWALLSGEDRPFAEALIALAPRSPFGLVVLEDVVHHVTARGFARRTTLDRLQSLIDSGWILRTPVEGEPGLESLGKSIFLYEYGRLSAYALEMIPLADR